MGSELCRTLTEHEPHQSVACPSMPKPERVQVKFVSCLGIEMIEMIGVVSRQGITFEMPLSSLLLPGKLRLPSTSTRGIQLYHTWPMLAAAIGVSSKEASLLLQSTPRLFSSCLCSCLAGMTSAPWRTLSNAFARDGGMTLSSCVCSIRIRYYSRYAGIYKQMSKFLFQSATDDR